MLGGCDLFMSLREAARAVGSFENLGCKLWLAKQYLWGLGAES